jgi:hypothetical protein
MNPEAKEIAAERIRIVLDSNRVFGGDSYACG